MKSKIPETIFGIEVKGAMERALKAEEDKQPEQDIKPADELSDYIHVPSINLYLSKTRTLQGLTWPNTHIELQAQGARMPTIPEFIAFIKYLKHDYKDRAEAWSILDDILTVRSPYRAEWLDAKFEKKNGIFHVNHGHKVQGNQLVASYSEPLEDCLMKDKTPGIDMEDWLNNPTLQGLPKQNIETGALYYWHPRENAVARFVARSDRAVLVCDGDPQDSYSALGVRRAKNFP